MKNEDILKRDNHNIVANVGPIDYSGERVGDVISESGGADTDELEQLKAQITMLREELTRSRIVNDKIMRQAMRERSSWLNTFVKFEAISTPLFGLIFIGVLYLFRVSIWPGIVFIIIGFISTWVDFGITSNNILTMPLLKLKEKLAVQKRQRLIQLIVEMPLTVLWLLWFALTLNSGLNPDKPITKYINIGGSVGLLVGLIVGIIVGIVVYLKAQDTNNELIYTIDRTPHEDAGEDSKE